MDIATSFSLLNNSRDAIIEAINKLDEKIAPPSLLLLYFSEDYDCDILQSMLTEHYPNTPFLACSSCQGFMTEDGYIKGQGLALWAINDIIGAYGTSIVSSNSSIFNIARQAILKAINNSGRIGESPALILLHATPGNEEEVIRGIEDVVGKNIAIIGGSAADNNVEGKWQIFNQEQQTQQGIGITVFYPNCEISFSFHSGYAATEYSAIATKVRGREVIELDHQPAADVYQKWIQQKFEANSSIINESSLNPLGRLVGTIHDLPYFKLAHPLMVTQTNGLKMFASIIEGERLYFMTGTDERLITRAGRVITATNGIKLNPIGGLTIYCAGCMLKVQQRMNEVAVYVNIAMHNKPFVCPFTFGEQGQFVTGENAHGNLMISAVVFHRD
ncbi:FIST N-terminal domain-containing protein [Photobacterium sp. S4TG1]|uniref:FIST signal transduction protein n=1 Tax=Photobacterium sp. S4TG1 TaxID=3114587 RepID=UPI002E173929|nr:FIST N-terminal domain-containing protein [Photobacterium sp. S4TG1]